MQRRGAGPGEAPSHPLQHGCAREFLLHARMCVRTAPVAGVLAGACVFALGASVWSRGWGPGKGA